MAISDRIDSIEQHLKESYQELQGIGIDTSEVNNNLENIPKLIDGYWQTLPKVTGDGTSITLDNTKEGKMGIIYKGNTSQVQYSGKNLINPFTYSRTNNDVYFSYNSDGSITVNGTATGTAYAIANADVTTYTTLTAGTYTLSCNNTGVSIRVDDSTGSNISNTSTSKTFTLTETKQVYIQIRVGNGTSINNVTIYPMIESGSSATDYVPPTNGKGSPSPDYPQEIQVVSGDNTIKVEGKNLVDLSTLTANYVPSVSSGQLVYLNGSASTNYISIDNTKDYVFSYTISGNTNPYIFFYGENNSYLGNKELTTGSSYQLSNSTYYSNSKSIKLRFDKYSQYNTIQLEVGSTATPYQPYQGASYPINLPVENLFNQSTSSILNVSRVTWASDLTQFVTLLNTLNEGTYSISYKIKFDSLGSATGYRNIGYRIDNSVDGASNNRRNITVVLNEPYEVSGNIVITSSNKGNFTHFYLYSKYDGSSDDYTTTYDFQLEVGTKVNSYTPYGTTPIELCKIGTYQDRIFKSSGKNLFDYKTPNINQITWTPTDNGGLFTSSTFWRNLGNKLELDTTKQYTFSFGARNSTKLYYYIRTYTDETYQTVKTTIVNDGTALSKTFTPDSKYVSIYFANGGNLQHVEIPNIQLEESPTKTEFEPYLPKGTWYLNKQIGKVVLDGDTNKVTLYGNYGDDNKPLFYMNKSDMVIPSAYTKKILMSDNYTQYIGSTPQPMANNQIRGANSTARIYLRDDRFTTASDFNTQLQNSNVLINYVLATPTYTEIEGTLKEQLEAIKTSYEGQTNISQENNDLASVLNASALSNTTITPSLQSIQPLSLGQSLQNEEPMVEEEPLIDEETPNETLQEDIIQENDNLTDILDDSELENM